VYGNKEWKYVSLNTQSLTIKDIERGEIFISNSFKIIIKVLKFWVL
jgi:hypothetical protein